MATTSRLTAASDGSDATSVSSGTLTTVEFPTEDIAGGFRASSPPTHGFKVPAGVTRVRFKFFVSMAVLGSGDAYNFRIQKNGTTNVIIAGRAATSGSSTYEVISTGLIDCAEGDTFLLLAFQNSGGSKSVNAVSGVGTFYFEIEDATP